MIDSLTRVSEFCSASSDMHDTDVGAIEVGRRLSEPKDQRLLPDGNSSGMFPSSIACTNTINMEQDIT